MPSTLNAFAFLDPPSASVPQRRYSSEHTRVAPSPPTLSRNSSNASTASRKSEPGWLTAMNEMNRSRAGSMPEKASSRPSAGFSKLFSKKKDKKDNDLVVLTSRHTAVVKNKLTHDPKFKTVRRESVPVTAGGPPVSQNSLHISARQQEMRHPHSGTPALSPPPDKSDMPLLTRIISGDEADELDEWEKLRDEWRQRKAPTLDNNIIEGVAVDGASSEPPTPGDQERKESETRPDYEVDRQRIMSVAGMKGEEYEPRPSRTHMPIGNRWKKDEKGAWKR